MPSNLVFGERRAIFFSCAEFFGLGDGSIREFLAGKAVRKTEIVFDFGAGGGLSAGRFGLDKKDVETLLLRG